MSERMSTRGGRERKLTSKAQESVSQAAAAAGGGGAADAEQPRAKRAKKDCLLYTSPSPRDA